MDEEQDASHQLCTCFGSSSAKNTIAYYSADLVKIGSIISRNSHLFINIFQFYIFEYYFFSDEIHDQTIRITLH